ncbi:energy transducer TonB [Dyadobacter sp. CY261]|uniref:energy transducer TonB n=1 Tax=Dyadobacter sp. CY261 TaxID=2907203 RepID=UPI001F36255D|nr:energy transducer TonB [Dyadobacter sp. CY261]MCF0074360.1 energy transducer TonB [Dyadobacter sp. CY261]
MKNKYTHNNEQPAGGDECKVIVTSLILFILSSILRHFGKSFALGKGVTLSLLFVFMSFPSEAFNPYAHRNCFLIFHGDTLIMDSYPLSDLPGAQKELVDRLSLSEKPDGSKCYSPITLYWEVHDDQLFLVKADSECYSDAQEKATLEFIFRKYYHTGEVAADWYSGSVYGMVGPAIWVSTFVAPVFKTEWECVISKGKLVDVRHHDNSKSRRSVYADKPHLLSRTIYSGINWKKVPEIQGTLSRVFLKFSANENGIVDQVEVLKGLDEQTNKEAIRVIKLIPSWFVVFRHGKIERVPYTIPIDFGAETRKMYQK